jgi:hypothetical protein
MQKNIVKKLVCKVLKPCQKYQHNHSQFNIPITHPAKTFNTDARRIENIVGSELKKLVLESLETQEHNR